MHQRNISFLAKFGTQYVTESYNTPIASQVLVYRPEKDNLRVLFSLFYISGEDYTVSPSSGPTKFRSTVVKQYQHPPRENSYESTITVKIQHSSPDVFV